MWAPFGARRRGRFTYPGAGPSTGPEAPTVGHGEEGPVESAGQPMDVVAAVSLAKLVGHLNAEFRERICRVAISGLPRLAGKTRGHLQGALRQHAKVPGSFRVAT